jgi:ribosomal protein S18 acetylase RimI-like enzyme
VSAYGVQQQTRELGDGCWWTVLMETADALAGYAQVRLEPSPTGAAESADIEIHRFYVDAPFHGRGAGALLMAAALDAARALGGRRVWLGVWERNTRAIRFYEKQGFRDAGTTHFFVGPDRQLDRVMVRVL